jgi:hypothetical protein
MISNQKLIQTLYHFLFGFPPDYESGAATASDSFDFSLNLETLVPATSSNTSSSFITSSNSLGFELSRINFANKLKKASHAINNPYQPPLEQPMSERVQQIQSILDSIENEVKQSSPVQ